MPSSLANQVLPLIRAQSRDLFQWRASNAQGMSMHEGVDLLVEAVDRLPAAEVYAVTQRAIKSAVTVILKADDSSGIIGDAIYRLLGLHDQSWSTPK